MCDTDKDGTFDMRETKHKSDLHNLVDVLLDNDNDGPINSDEHKVGIDLSDFKSYIDMSLSSRSILTEAVESLSSSEKV